MNSVAIGPLATYQELPNRLAIFITNPGASRSYAKTFIVLLGDRAKYISWALRDAAGGTAGLGLQT
jgi:hypothetical protein